MSRFEKSDFTTRDFQIATARALSSELQREHDHARRVTSLRTLSATILTQALGAQFDHSTSAWALFPVHTAAVDGTYQKTGEIMVVRSVDEQWRTAGSPLRQVPSIRIFGSHILSDCSNELLGVEEYSVDRYGHCGHEFGTLPIDILTGEVPISNLQSPVLSHDRNGIIRLVGDRAQLPDLVTNIFRVLKENGPLFSNPGAVEYLCAAMTGAESTLTFLLGQEAAQAGVGLPEGFKLPKQ